MEVSWGRAGEVFARHWMAAAPGGGRGDWSLPRPVCACGAAWNSLVPSSVHRKRSGRARMNLHAGTCSVARVAPHDGRDAPQR